MKVEVAVPGFPVPNNPYGPCGRKATLEEEEEENNEGCGIRDQELCESRGERLGSPTQIVRTDSVDVKLYLKKAVESEIRNSVTVDVDVLGSLYLIDRTVSVDVKQH